MEEKAESLAGTFHILSDPNRIVILGSLVDHELCACELLENLHISQSTLSHHMKILCEARMVFCRREGKWMYYSLSRRGFEEIFQFLQQMHHAADQAGQDSQCCR